MARIYSRRGAGEFPETCSILPTGGGGRSGTGKDVCRGDAWILRMAGRAALLGRPQRRNDALAPEAQYPGACVQDANQLPQRWAERLTNGRNLERPNRREDRVYAYSKRRQRSGEAPGDCMSGDITAINAIQACGARLSCDGHRSAYPSHEGDHRSAKYLPRATEKAERRAPTRGAHMVWKTNKRFCQFRGDDPRKGNTQEILGARGKRPPLVLVPHHGRRARMKNVCCREVPEKSARGPSTAGRTGDCDYRLVR